LTRFHSMHSASPSEGVCGPFWCLSVSRRVRDTGSAPSADARRAASLPRGGQSSIARAACLPTRNWVDARGCLRRPGATRPWTPARDSSLDPALLSAQRGSGDGRNCIARPPFPAPSLDSPSPLPPALGWRVPAALRLSAEARGVVASTEREVA